MFRDETVTCPDCEAALDPLGTRWRCAPCTTLLITDDEMAAMLAEMAPDDERRIEKRLFTTGSTGRTCPRCQTSMQRGRIFDTELERCPTHGIWIGEKALSDLLVHTQELYTKRRQISKVTQVSMVVPVIGPLAVAVDAILMPWTRRRRLRMFLAKTTPKPTP